MSKVQINTLLQTEKDQIKKRCKGVLIENKLSYLEDDILVTIEKKDNHLILKRKDKEKELIFLFDNKKSKLTIKTEDGSFFVDFITKKQIWKNQKIEIQYQIEENIHFFVEWRNLND